MSNANLCAIARVRGNHAPKSQVVQILDHMTMRGDISQLEASNYGIRRLASRITDLRREGVQIRATRKTDLQGTPYVRYSLV